MPQSQYCCINGAPMKSFSFSLSLSFLDFGSNANIMVDTVLKSKRIYSFSTMMWVSFWGIDIRDLTPYCTVRVLDGSALFDERRHMGPTWAPSQAVIIRWCWAAQHLTVQQRIRFLNILKLLSIFCFWMNYVQRYMDSEIRAIMAQYMPLDNQPDGPNQVHNEL